VVDAVLSVCHLIDRMPSSVLDGKILFSYLYPTKSVFFMTPRVFGCTCFVKDLSPGWDKLSPRSIKCVFVGYCRTQKGCRCYTPSTKKYVVYHISHSLRLFHIFPHSVLLLTLKLFIFHFCAIACTISCTCF